MLSRAPVPPRNFRRPVPVIARGKVPAAPRPKPVGQPPARKKWYQPKAAAPKTRINKPSAPKPRMLPKAPKRRVHVQVVPGRAPIRNAKQMGIHSGFVLIRAPQQKRQPAPPPARVAARKPKASPPSISDRFAEKKHIFFPINSRHFPTHEMASYHLDEIGNLIPDISNPKFFEPEQNKNPLAKPSSSCRIPMKRDGRCPIPVPKTIVTNQRTRYQSAKENIARQQHARQQQIARQQQLAHEIHMPPRTAVRKPAPPQSKLKSSQRILFFAHGRAPPPPPQNARYQQLRKQVSPPPARGRAPVAARAARPQPNRAQSPRAPSMYDVPKISNKVYNYINQRTSRLSTPQKAMNPLLKYIQYHRTHPDPRAPVETSDKKQSRIDKRSIVTVMLSKWYQYVY